MSNHKLNRTTISRISQRLNLDKLGRYGWLVELPEMNGTKGIKGGKLDNGTLTWKCMHTGTTGVDRRWSSLYVPARASVKLDTRCTARMRVNERNPVAWARVPIAKGSIVRLVPGKLVECVIWNGHEYDRRTFRSPRAVQQISSWRIVPWWIQHSKETSAFKPWFLAQLEHGLEFDDNGQPMIPMQGAGWKITGQMVDDVRNNLKMPMNLPFRAAAGMELVHAGCQIVELNDDCTMQQLQDDMQLQHIEYNMYGDYRAGILFLYELREVPESRILKNIQFNDTYWSSSEDGSGDDDGGNVSEE